MPLLPQYGNSSSRISSASSPSTTEIGLNRGSTDELALIPYDGLPTNVSSEDMRNNSEQSAATSPRRPLASTPKLRWPFVLPALLIVCFIAYSVAGVFSTEVPEDKSRLLASKDCGSWSLSDDADAQEQDLDDLYQAQKEARASDYARACYGAQSVASPDHCTFFYSQNITYSVKHDQPCPFHDPKICVRPFSAATFTTGLVDATYIGINVENAPKFRRSTTCAPLKHAGAICQGELNKRDRRT